LEKKRKSFSNMLRVSLKWLVEPVAGFFNRLGIHPNVMTVIGLIGTTIGAMLIARGDFTWGGVLILITVPFDALDGVMARLLNEASTWGAFVDSVCDRYSELVVHLALLVYFLSRNDKLACALVFLSAAGSVLVSYSKAKAEALGLDANVGLLTRVERFLIMTPALLFRIPIVALWILAPLTNFTALQRILNVRREFYRQKNYQLEQKDA